MVEVLFVGTGDAFGSGGRRNSAILVRSGGTSILLDCGPTTVAGLKELGVDPREIDVVAISHFHGDHAAGLPFLLLDYEYEDVRDRELLIAGPPGIRERTETMARSFEYWRENPSYPLRFVEFASARPLRRDGFELTALPAFHHPETCPHMLCVRIGGKSVFFSGDTGWTEQLPDQVADADLFICEATLVEESFEYHLSHERLKRERARFSCQQFVLTHLGREMLAYLDRVEFDTAHDGLEISLRS